MANRKYNKKEKVSNGYSNIAMKNKVKKIKDARESGDLSAAEKIIQDFDYIFENDTIDLTKATKVLNTKMTTHEPRIESKKLTGLLKELHGKNFFINSSGKSEFHSNSAIEKAIDFNDAIVYNSQGIVSFAS